MKRLIPLIAFIIGFSVFPLYTLGFWVAFTGRPYGVIIMFSGVIAMLAYVIYTIASPFLSNVNPPVVTSLRIGLLLLVLGVAAGYISIHIFE